MIIVPNIYFNINNICLSCGLPVANAKNKLAGYCQFPYYEEKSPCIVCRDRAAVKATRKLNLDKLPPVIVFTNKIKMRECLGVGCETKQDKYFVSQSNGNRFCKLCSRGL